MLNADMTTDVQMMNGSWLRVDTESVVFLDGFDDADLETEEIFVEG